MNLPIDDLKHPPETIGSTEHPKVLLVGQPNSGKSQVFNQLTRTYSPVANYAQTTMEFIHGKVTIGEGTYDLIDSPGVHCLCAHSEEDTLVRNWILREKPAVIVQCVDANRLKQSLLLTTDLLELDIPMVISLNAIDETTRNGIWIDAKALAQKLQLPVIESIAIKNIGIEQLKQAIPHAKTSSVRVRYDDLIEDGITHMTTHLSSEPHGRKLSIFMLQGDPFISSYLHEKIGSDNVALLEEDVQAIHNKFRGRYAKVINRQRSDWIDKLYEEIIHSHNIILSGKSRRISAWCRHPIKGLPFLIAVLTTVYFLVVDVANVLAGWMDKNMWLPVEHAIRNNMAEGFWQNFIIGDYGVLSLGLANALITVLPILSVFFLAYNTLEDIGYIPNLCVLIRRLFSKIGLSGNALMPTVLAFGCKTMATMSAQSLKSRKERIIATYLIAFAIPCAAQMGLTLSILGSIGASAIIIAFGSLFLFEVLAGLILKFTLKDDIKQHFVQELPPIRIPNPKNVAKKTYFRMKEFLGEAVPIFVIAAVVMFAAHETGLLTIVRDALEPVIVTFLGLPIEMVDALVLCLARHEAAAALIIDLKADKLLSDNQCIVAVLAIFVPCFANVIAIAKGFSPKVAAIMALSILANSLILAGIVNALLGLW